MKTILLVEDDDVQAFLETELLQKNQFSVVHAKSGEDAIEIIKTNHLLSLVLMDIDLGSGISGSEAAEQIMRTRNIPIIFLTSHTEKEYIDKVRDITKFGYVIKNSGEFVLIESIRMAYELFNAYQKIQESEEKYRLIAENSSDGLLIIEDNKIVYTSPAYNKILGYEMEEEIGKTDVDIELLIHPDDRYIIQDIYNAIENKLEGITYTYRALSKNGEYKWREDKAKFIYNDFGIYTRAYVVCRDISDRFVHTC